MTIAVVLKVHDGVVLAADSASSMTGPDASGNPAVWNVYNNANKIINLYKGLPIGGITWGAGSIGFASITTLAKDLRARLSDPNNKQWAISPGTYTIEEVAVAARRFLFRERMRTTRAQRQRRTQGGLFEAFEKGPDAKQ